MAMSVRDVVTWTGPYLRLGEEGDRPRPQNKYEIWTPRFFLGVY